MVKKREKAEERAKIAEERAKRKADRQINIVIGIIVGLIVLILLFVLVINASNSFKYLGLEFKKIKYGDIVLYTTSVPLADSMGQVTGYMPTDFRNDPRKLRDIAVETARGIKFLNNQIIYISMDPYMEKCEDNGLALTNLGMFLKNAGLNAKPAFTDEAYALEQKYPYITCANSSLNTVLIIKSGNETAIKETQDDCYEITFKDCEVTRATEKFQLTVLKEYNERITS